MRIAIVNDLALAREVLRQVVLTVPGYTIAWQAEDGAEAIRKATDDRPDVILMDLVMPRINGAEATRQIMRQSPCPIVVVTATVPGHFELVYQAMSAGALDVVETPTSSSGQRIEKAAKLLEKLAYLEVANRGASVSPSLLTASAAKNIDKPDRPAVVAIGSSTGGPEALNQFLAALPAGFPAAVVIAQHIAEEYARGLADRLGIYCKLPVDIARDGDLLVAGTVAIAATNDHLELGTDHRLHYTPHPRQAPYRPSADILFASLASRGPKLGVGILLTGMGTDGAAGLLLLRRAGWHTIVQDVATCVVHGMPGAAIALGAAIEVLPIQLIAPTTIALLATQKR